MLISKYVCRFARSQINPKLPNEAKRDDKVVQFETLNLNKTTPAGATLRRERNPKSPTIPSRRKVAPTTKYLLISDFLPCLKTLSTLQLI